jgi:hypothetical protein
LLSLAKGLPFHANRAAGVRTALGTAGDGLGGSPMNTGVAGPFRRVGTIAAAPHCARQLCIVRFKSG